MPRKRKIKEKEDESLQNAEIVAKLEVEKKQEVENQSQKPLSKVPGKLRKFL